MAAMWLGLCGVAQAQQAGALGVPGLKLSAGAAVASTPSYIGSDETRGQVLPLLLAQQGIWFLDSARGLGYRRQFSSGLFFGQALFVDLGRLQRKTSWRPGAERLRGMGDIRGTAVLTTELGYEFAPWLSVLAEGEWALGRRERGDRARLALQGGLWNSAEHDFWYELDARFGERDYVQTYFGVSAAQSAATGFAPHAPKRGLYAYGYSLSWEYRFARPWSALLSLQGLQLVGDAGRSPIVQRRHGLTGLAGINYSF